jgi:hypothetical protein
MSLRSSGLAFRAARPDKSIHRRQPLRFFYNTTGHEPRIAFGPERLPVAYAYPSALLFWTGPALRVPQGESGLKGLPRP